jgi:hypothetical protein
MCRFYTFSHLKRPFTGVKKTRKLVKSIVGITPTMV